MMRAVLLVVGLLLAGCITTTPTQDDPEITIRGVVLDASDAPIPAARVDLEHAAGIESGTTDAQGGFSFTIAPGTCGLRVQADGFLAREVALACTNNTHVTIRLTVARTDPPPVPPAPPQEEDVPPPAPKYEVRGIVEDQDGLPVQGATVRIDKTQQVTNASGRFSFRLLDGTYAMQTLLQCADPVARNITVAGAPLEIQVLVQRGGVVAVAAPQIIETAAGPGPGMSVFQWDADPAARGYVVYRDGQPFHVGANTVFADHADGATEYAVSAVDGCGREGPRSQAVSLTPLAGASPTVGTRGLVSADGSLLRAYPTFDADLQLTGSSTWRIVTGTGNCCENYVTTDASGRIVDFGGTFLHFSDDEGVSWKTVNTPIPYLTGEGAQVTAPNGDIVGVGWSPYTGDQLWAHKYVAADDQWYYQIMPIHQPFFDRAWVSIVQGPMHIRGQLVPYIVQVESNYHGGFATVLLRSLDGLTYYEPTEPQTSVGESSSQMPALGPNPDADWIQPIEQSPTVPVAPGAGLQARSGIGVGCVWNLLLEDGGYACPPEPFPDSRWPAPIVDSQGSIHIIRHDNAVHYTVHHEDASATVKVPYPDGWRRLTSDAKVNAGLDTAVVAIHMAHSDGRTGDFLYRFINITGTPEAAAIHQVGAADTGSDAGVTGDRRFDFMTVGMLPDGRAVLSFTDSEFHPPALAIEQ